MKTLTEHNQEMHEAHHKAVEEYGKPKLNGIACPECGAELMDSTPHITLTSNPPQKNVKCSVCDYVGYRVC